MPKVSKMEAKAVAAAQRRVNSPYARNDAPCTLFLKKKVLYRKKEDGTLDKNIQTVSNKWYDGTMTCNTGTERPDIWVVKADVEKGIDHLKDVKSVKYMLYSLKDLCKCRCYHKLTKIVRQEEIEVEDSPPPSEDENSAEPEGECAASVGHAPQ